MEYKIRTNQRVFTLDRLMQHYPHIIVKKPTAVGKEMALIASNTRTEDDLFVFHVNYFRAPAEYFIYLWTVVKCLFSRWNV